MILSCACCEARVQTRTISAEEREVRKALGKTQRPLAFDAEDRYWCFDCWDGEPGKRGRRLAKLRTLAERGTPEERAVAFLRIAEMEKKPTPSLQADLALARAELDRAVEEAQKRIVEIDHKIAKQKRLLRVKRDAWILSMIAIALSFAAKYPLTGGFFGQLGLSCSGIGLYFAFRPNEHRVTMRQAVVYAFAFALLCWCSEMVWAVFAPSREV